jgi:hypothetical protein
MDRRIAPIHLLALLLALAALASPAATAQEEDPAAGDRPVAVFPSLAHNFGEVDRGDSLTHAFIVRNEGNVPLEILSAKPT